MVTLLYMYSDRDRLQEQQPTRDYVKQLEELPQDSFPNKNFKLVRCVTDPNLPDTSTKVVDALRSLWGSDDIIMLEMDKVPRIAQFMDLLECWKDVCGFIFPVGKQIANLPFLWTKGGDTYSTLLGTGFLKISKDIQLKTDFNYMKNPIDLGIDIRLCKFLIEQGHVSLHVHGMVVHNHLNQRTYDSQQVRKAQTYP